MQHRKEACHRKADGHCGVQVGTRDVRRRVDQNHQGHAVDGGTPPKAARSGPQIAEQLSGQEAKKGMPSSPWRTLGRLEEDPSHPSLQIQRTDLNLNLNISGAYAELFVYQTGAPWRTRLLKFRVSKLIRASQQLHFLLGVEIA